MFKSINRQLFSVYLLYFIEYVAYVGISTLIALFVVNYLSISNGDSVLVASNCNELLYLSPVIGGIIADRYLGFRSSVVLGGIFLSIGYITLGITTSISYFYLSFSFVVTGFGLFRTNIYCILGNICRDMNLSISSQYSKLFVSVHAP